MAARAKAAMPSWKSTCASKPSSFRARSVEANTCRTSPGRCPPTTSGRSAPAPAASTRLVGQVEDRSGPPAGHVERAGTGGGRAQGQHVGPGDVVDVDEVTPLPAVLHDPRGLPAGDRTPEDARDAGIGGVPGHPRPVHVVVPQDGELDPRMLGGERPAQVFLVGLGRGVHAAGVDRGVLGNGLGHELAATGRARRFPAARRETVGRPGARPHQAVLGAPVPTFAVDDHAAGEDETAREAESVEGPQQGRGADVVVVAVGDDVGEVDAEAHHGRLVTHRIGGPERGRERRLIGHVDPLVVDVDPEVRRWAGVGHGEQGVDAADLVPRVGELVDDV